MAVVGVGLTGPELQQSVVIVRHGEAPYWRTRRDIRGVARVMCTQVVSLVTVTLPGGTEYLKGIQLSSYRLSTSGFCNGHGRAPGTWRTIFTPGRLRWACWRGTGRTYVCERAGECHLSKRTELPRLSAN